MTRHTIPLGKIFGIPIGLDYSWFLIFGLLTWMLAASYYPTEFKHWTPLQYWATGALTSIALFASVLLHELGHSVVAMRYKIPVRSITLFLFGGVAEIGSEPPGPLAEFLIAIAGPFVSLVLGVFFMLLLPVTAPVETIYGLVEYLAYINIALVVFNLIPGYPLDGGRVFRAIVWAITGNMRRATLIAANVGRFFAFLFFGLGVWAIFSGDLGGGLWIIFIGWFLDKTASAQIQMTLLRGLLAGHTVAQAMGDRCAEIPAYLTLQELVDDHVLGAGQRCFLVHQDNSHLGLMTLHRIKEIPRTEWPLTTAGEVMLPLDQSRQVTPQTGLWAALQLMDRGGVNQLPVLADGRVVGMLSREDVITFLSTLQALGG
ncbi:MAG: site-2 protease family protein [Planctomycetota bacterium]